MSTDKMSICSSAKSTCVWCVSWFLSPEKKNHWWCSKMWLCRSGSYRRVSSLFRDCSFATTVKRTHNQQASFGGDPPFPIQDNFQEFFIHQLWPLKIVFHLHAKTVCFMLLSDLQHPVSLKVPIWLCGRHNIHWSWPRSESTKPRRSLLKRGN